MMLTRVFDRKRIFIAALTLLLCATVVQAQTTAFTYQGKLSAGGNPANGSYDMQFKIFDALTEGVQQGATITNPTVAVSAGLFTVELNFGSGVFDGTSRFLEIGVRPAGSPDPYIVLVPRQSITSIPYALHSMKAAAASRLPMPNSRSTAVQRACPLFSRRACQGAGFGARAQIVAGFTVRVSTGLGFKASAASARVSLAAARPVGALTGILPAPPASAATSTYTEPSVITQRVELRNLGGPAIIRKP